MLKNISKKVLILFGLGIVCIVSGAVLLLLSTSNESTKEYKYGDPIELDTYEVTNAYNYYNKLRIFETELFNNNGFDINQISDDSLLSTLLKQIPTDFIGYCGDFTSEEKGQVNIDSLNGWLREAIQDKDISIDFIQRKATFYDPAFDINTTVINEKSSEFGVSEFLGIKDEQIYVGSNMCEPQGNVSILKEKIEKAEKDGDYVYLFMKRAFYLLLDGQVNYYKDPTLSTFVESFDAEVTQNEMGMTERIEQSKELSWDKYNTYVLKFKSIDGNYYLVSTELKK